MLQDVFNSDAFTAVSLTAKLKKVPYRFRRIKELGLFDEKPINTLSVAIAEKDGQLNLIAASPRGAAGDYIGNVKGKLRSFTVLHLTRSAKLMADEVQGVLMFGSDNQLESVDAKIAEKLEILSDMHEQTWEYHRLGAILGKVLDADGSTVLYDLYSIFEVSQTTSSTALTTTTTDIRAWAESIADSIDDELGGSGYERVHAFLGGTFYDTLISHKFVQDYLKQIAVTGNTTLMSDLRGGGTGDSKPVSGFTIGPVTFERARRWKLKTPAGDTINAIAPTEGYAFPVGASDQDGAMFKGYFGPQPFDDCVNKLNPPLVVKSQRDQMGKFIEMEGVSCPLFINTRPKATIKLAYT